MRPTPLKIDPTNLGPMGSKKAQTPLITLDTLSSISISRTSKRAEKYFKINKKILTPFKSFTDYGRETYFPSSNMTPLKL